MVKTKEELFQEELMSMSTQIKLLKVNHEEELQRLRSKHAEEIKKLTNKHAEDLGDLMNKQEESSFYSKMESLATHLDSKKSEVDALLQGGGNMIEYITKLTEEFLRQAFSIEHKSSSVIEQEKNEDKEMKDAENLEEEDKKQTDKIPDGVNDFPVFDADIPCKDLVLSNV
ncbi:hypothetical protein MKX01_035052 [Papaver californicum]|nr:hypothetical protein MKX01_035052 [Papaver californicum]